MASFPLARALVEGCKGGASCEIARIVRRNRRCDSDRCCLRYACRADNIDNAKKC